MIKKKKILLSLIVIILCVSIAMLAFACSNDDDEDTDTDDTTTEDTALFTNGDFTKYSVDDDSAVSYPVAPTGWTATPGSTSSSSTIKTPQGTDDISVGVISVGSDYDQDTYGIANPGKPTGAEDDNILMIRNKVATSYSYVSSSTTIAKDSYYKLSFWVKTVGIEAKTAGDDYGAYVYVKGSAYAEFECINTDETWKEYIVYFRGSNTGDKTITLSLGLGEGNYSTGHMVKGYAYFDHVVLTNLTDVAEGETAYTEAEFNALEYTATQSKFDMRALDGNFNYTSSVATLPIYNITQLTGSAGSGSGTSASSGSSYLEKGILDLSQAGASKVFSGYSLDPLPLSKAVSTDLGDKVVMIHNKQLTAYTYKDNIGMFIKSKKYYKITAYVQTNLSSASQAGAYLTLNSSSNELASIEDIKTSGAWTQYTFYVEGNQYADNTLYVSMSLGKGGSGDNTWAQGVAFFDDLFYEEVELTKTDYEAIAETATVKKCSYYDAESDADLKEGLASLITSTVYEDSFKTLDATTVDETQDSLFTKVDGTTKIKTLAITNTKLTAYSASTITKKDDGSADETNKALFTVNPNTAYKITMWVKTANLNTDGAASIALFSYDDEKKADYDSCKTTLSTMSAINDTTLESYMNEDYDNYSLISFYVLGDIKDTKYLGLDVSFGTGDSAAKSASLVSGTLYIANLRMVKIPYEDYNSASTGTTAFKYSFVGSGESGEISSNGTFSFVDMDSTITLYGDKYNDPLYPEKNVWNLTTGVLEKTAVPTNWTITDSAALALSGKGGTSVAGVIDANNVDSDTYDATLNDVLSMDYASYSANKSVIYSSLDAGLTLDDCPQVLAIAAKSVKSLGYKSTSISLSANSYYVFSVYAKTNNTGVAISVAQSGVTDYTNYTLQSDAPGTDWKHYLIYVKTGISSTSVNVTLYAGSPLNPSANNFNALFTMATYSSIDKAIYDKATESATVKKLAWFTDTMDLTSSAATDTALATPTNWTGAAIDSSASTDSDDLAKGVFNRLNGNWDTIKIDPDETDTFADKIFDGANHNDSVLVIYNKNATSYGYTSTSFTLTKGTYYKVSVDVLTKGIRYLTEEDIDSDDDTYKDWTDKKLIETATISLAANNKTYTFGKATEKGKTEADFTGDTAAEDWAAYQLAASRQVTVDTWTTYTYYIKMADDISDSVSATLKLSLGGKNVSYWEYGYLFVDNFTVEEIEASTYDDEAITNNATTYKISYTQEDASAEEESDEEESEEEEEEEEQKNWLWLYITSGIIGGLLVIILVIYIIKKYAPKKGIKKAKKTLTSDNSTRGKFGN